MKIYSWKGKRFLQQKWISKSHRIIAVIVIIFLTVLLYWIYNRKYSSLPKRETCSSYTGVFSEEGITSSSCATLKPIECLADADVLEVEGKYMQETKEMRKEANFLMQPNSLKKAPTGCRVETEKTKWNLVFLVKSSLIHRERRNAIRSTWGAVKMVDSARLEVVFIVGTSSNRDAQMELEHESQVHGDLLQMNLDDTSKTVPEKVLAGMQWSSRVFPEEWLYASVDDDIVVHSGNLVAFLDQLLQPVNPTSRERPCYEELPLVCFYSYQPWDIPQRDVEGKWYMPLEVYPQKYWPKYCRGGMYLMPIKMVKSMYEASRRTEHLYLDDVWITGFMRRKLNQGDCNIMPAPYSEDENGWLQWWHKIIGSYTPLLQHLWGNIHKKPVNIPSKIQSVWKSWKGSMHGSRICIFTGETDFVRDLR